MKPINITTWNALPAICRRTDADGTRYALINGSWTPVKLIRAFIMAPPTKRVTKV